MKMTCNGGAPRTLQAAFEINISSLRPLGRRTAPAASPQGGDRYQWRTLKPRIPWRVPLQWRPMNDNQSPARIRIFSALERLDYSYVSLEASRSNLISHIRKQMKESLQTNDKHLILINMEIIIQNPRRSWNLHELYRWLGLKQKIICISAFYTLIINNLKRRGLCWMIKHELSEIRNVCVNTCITTLQINKRYHYCKSREIKW